jgi:hypothetical protein
MPDRSVNASHCVPVEKTFRPCHVHLLIPHTPPIEPSGAAKHPLVLHRDMA